MSAADPAARRLMDVVIATLLTTAVFLAFPDIDLRISGLFGGADGFPLRRSAALNAVRDAMIVLTDGTVAASAGLLILGTIRPRLRVVRRRILGFCVIAYGLCPGMLVNGVLKSLSGRARPWNLSRFGGDRAFTAVLHPADQCSSHCSFVSGEASALATVATLAILLAVPMLPDRARPAARRAIVGVAAAGSLLRVAFGAHFLSDVIFAALVSVFSVLALYLCCGMHRPDRPGIALTAPRPI